MTPRLPSCLVTTGVTGADTVDGVTSSHARDRIFLKLKIPKNYPPPRFVILGSLFEQSFFSFHVPRDGDKGVRGGSRRKNVSFPVF